MDVDQDSKSSAVRSNRREPFAFAYFGLILFLIVYFIRPEDWVSPLSRVPLARITGILIFVALVFPFLRIRWRLPEEIIFLILLVAQLWLAAVFSPVWKGGAVIVMAEFSKVLLLVMVVYLAVRSTARLRWVLFVQSASVAAIAVASIAARRMAHGRLEGVLQGIYRNPNDFAVLIDLTLPLCLALALTTGSNWKKVTWIVMMLAMIYAVFLTASRDGAIALAVVVLMFVWRFGIKGRRVSVILLIALAAFVFWIYSANLLKTRFGQTDASPTTRSQTSEAYLSAQNRLQLLTQSLRITAEHPVRGVGPGNFPIVSGWFVTHNTYTQISAEGGILALLLYVLVFWHAFANLRRIRKNRQTRKAFRVFAMALEASLAAYLVGSFFLSLAYHLFPYCLVAYTCALWIIVKKEQMASRLPSKLPAPAPIEAAAWQ
jgi:O-antigen ligase